MNNRTLQDFFSLAGAVDTATDDILGPAPQQSPQQPQQQVPQGIDPRAVFAQVLGTVPDATTLTQALQAAGGARLGNKNAVPQVGANAQLFNSVNNAAGLLENRLATYYTQAFADQGANPNQALKLAQQRAKDEVTNLLFEPQFAPSLVGSQTVPSADPLAAPSRDPLAASAAASAAAPVNSALGTAGRIVENISQGAGQLTGAAAAAIAPGIQSSNATAAEQGVAAGTQDLAQNTESFIRNPLGFLRDAGEAGVRIFDNIITDGVPEAAGSALELVGNVTGSERLSSAGRSLAERNRREFERGVQDALTEVDNQAAGNFGIGFTRVTTNIASQLIGGRALATGALKLISSIRGGRTLGRGAELATATGSASAIAGGQVLLSEYGSLRNAVDSGEITEEQRQAHAVFTGGATALVATLGNAAAFRRIIKPQDSSKFNALYNKMINADRRVLGRTRNAVASYGIAAATQVATELTEESVEALAGIYSEITNLDRDAESTIRENLQQFVGQEASLITVVSALMGFGTNFSGRRQIRRTGDTQNQPSFETLLDENTSAASVNQILSDANIDTSNLDGLADDDPLGNASAAATQASVGTDTRDTSVDQTTVTREDGAQFQTAGDGVRGDFGISVVDTHQDIADQVGASEQNLELAEAVDLGELEQTQVAIGDAMNSIWVPITEEVIGQITAEEGRADVIALSEELRTRGHVVFGSLLAEADSDTTQQVRNLTSRLQETESGSQERVALVRELSGLLDTAIGTADVGSGSREGGADPTATASFASLAGQVTTESSISQATNGTPAARTRILSGTEQAAPTERTPLAGGSDRDNIARLANLGVTTFAQLEQTAQDTALSAQDRNRAQAVVESARSGSVAPVARNTIPAADLEGLTAQDLDEAVDALIGEGRINTREQALSELLTRATQRRLPLFGRRRTLGAFGTALLNRAQRIARGRGANTSIGAVNLNTLFTTALRAKGAVFSRNVADAFSDTLVTEVLDATGFDNAAAVQDAARTDATIRNTIDGIIQRRITDPTVSEIQSQIRTVVGPNSVEARQLQAEREAIDELIEELPDLNGQRLTIEQLMRVITTFEQTSDVGEAFTTRALRRIRNKQRARKGLTPTNPGEAFSIGFGTGFFSDLITVQDQVGTKRLRELRKAIEGFVDEVAERVKDNTAGSTNRLRDRLVRRRSRQTTAGLAGEVERVFERAIAHAGVQRPDVTVANMVDIVNTYLDSTAVQVSPESQETVEELTRRLDTLLQSEDTSSDAFLEALATEDGRIPHNAYLAIQSLLYQYGSPLAATLAPIAPELVGIADNVTPEQLSNAVTGIYESSKLRANAEATRRSAAGRVQSSADSLAVEREFENALRDARSIESQVASFFARASGTAATRVAEDYAEAALEAGTLHAQVLDPNAYGPGGTVAIGNRNLSLQGGNPTTTITRVLRDMDVLPSPDSVYTSISTRPEQLETFLAAEIDKLRANPEYALEMNPQMLYILGAVLGADIGVSVAAGASADADVEADVTFTAFGSREAQDNYLQRFITSATVTAPRVANEFVHRIDDARLRTALDRFLPKGKVTPDALSDIIYKGSFNNPLRGALLAAISGEIATQQTLRQEEALQTHLATPANRDRLARNMQVLMNPRGVSEDDRIRATGYIQSTISGGDVVSGLFTRSGILSSATGANARLKDHRNSFIADVGSAARATTDNLRNEAQARLSPIINKLVGMAQGLADGGSLEGADRRIQNVAESLAGLGAAANPYEYIDTAIRQNEDGVKNGVAQMASLLMLEAELGAEVSTDVLNGLVAVSETAKDFSGAAGLRRLFANPSQRFAELRDNAIEYAEVQTQALLESIDGARIALENMDEFDPLASRVMSSDALRTQVGRALFVPSGTQVPLVDGALDTSTTPLPNDSAEFAVASRLRDVDTVLSAIDQLIGQNEASPGSVSLQHIAGLEAEAARFFSSQDNLTMYNWYKWSQTQDGRSALGADAAALPPSEQLNAVPGTLVSSVRYLGSKLGVDAGVVQHFAALARAARDTNTKIKVGGNTYDYDGLLEQLRILESRNPQDKDSLYVAERRAHDNPSKTNISAVRALQAKHDAVMQGLRVAGRGSRRVTEEAVAAILNGSVEAHMASPAFTQELMKVASGLVLDKQYGAAVSLLERFPTVDSGGMLQHAQTRARDGGSVANNPSIVAQAQEEAQTQIGKYFRLMFRDEERAVKRVASDGIVDAALKASGVRGRASNRQQAVAGFAELLQEVGVPLEELTGRRATQFLRKKGDLLARNEALLIELEAVARSGLVNSNVLARVLSDMGADINTSTASRQKAFRNLERGDGDKVLPLAEQILGKAPALDVARVIFPDTHFTGSKRRKDFRTGANYDQQHRLTVLIEAARKVNKEVRASNPAVSDMQAVLRLMDSQIRYHTEDARPGTAPLNRQVRKAHIMELIMGGLEVAQARAGRRKSGAVNFGSLESILNDAGAEDGQLVSRIVKAQSLLEAGGLRTAGDLQALRVNVASQILKQMYTAYSPDAEANNTPLDLVLAQTIQLYIDTNLKALTDSNATDADLAATSQRVDAIVETVQELSGETGLFDRLRGSGALKRLADVAGERSKFVAEWRKAHDTTAVPTATIVTDPETGSPRFGEPLLRLGGAFTLEELAGAIRMASQEHGALGAGRVEFLNDFIPPPEIIFGQYSLTGENAANAINGVRSPTLTRQRKAEDAVLAAAESKDKSTLAWDATREFFTAAGLGDLIRSDQSSQSTRGAIDDRDGSVNTVFLSDTEARVIVNNTLGDQAADVTFRDAARATGTRRLGQRNPTPATAPAVAASVDTPRPTGQPTENAASSIISQLSSGSSIDTATDLRRLFSTTPDERTYIDTAWRDAISSMEDDGRSVVQTLESAGRVSASSELGTANQSVQDALQELLGRFVVNSVRTAASTTNLTATQIANDLPAESSITISPGLLEVRGGKLEPLKAQFENFLRSGQFRALVQLTVAGGNGNIRASEVTGLQRELSNGSPFSQRVSRIWLSGGREPGGTTSGEARGVATEAPLLPQTTTETEDSSGSGSAASLASVRALNTNETLQEARDRVYAEISRGQVGIVEALEKNGVLTIVRQAADIPSNVLQGLSPGERESRYLQGVTADDGRVYLVTENLPRGGAWPVLLHELGIHSGLVGVVGRSGLADLARSVRQLAAKGDLVARRAMAKFEYAASLNPALRDFSTYAAQQELVAYMTEEQARTPDSRSWVDKLLDYVKQFTAKLFGGTNTILGRPDFVALATASMRSLVTQQTKFRGLEAGGSLASATKPDGVDLGGGFVLEPEFEAGVQEDLAKQFQRRQEGATPEEAANGTRFEGSTPTTYSHNKMLGALRAEGTRRAEFETRFVDGLAGARLKREALQRQLGVNALPSAVDFVSQAVLASDSHTDVEDFLQSVFVPGISDAAQSMAQQLNNQGVTKSDGGKWLAQDTVRAISTYISAKNARDMNTAYAMFHAPWEPELAAERGKVLEAALAGQITAADARTRVRALLDQQLQATPDTAAWIAEHGGTSGMQPAAIRQVLREKRAVFEAGAESLRTVDEFMDRLASIGRDALVQARHVDVFLLDLYGVDYMLPAHRDIKGDNKSVLSALRAQRSGSASRTPVRAASLATAQAIGVKARVEPDGLERAMRWSLLATQQRAENRVATALKNFDATYKQDQAVQQLMPTSVTGSAAVLQVSETGTLEQAAFVRDTLPDNAFLAYSGGTAELIQVGQAGLETAVAIKSLWRHNAPDQALFSTGLFKYLNSSGRLMMSLITRWNPFFWPKAFLRDSQTYATLLGAEIGPAAMASFTSELAQLTARRFGVGTMATLQRDIARVLKGEQPQSDLGRDYRDLRSFGALTSRARFVRQFGNSITFEESLGSKVSDAIPDGVKEAGSVLDYLSESVEMMPRIAVYRALQSHGFDKRSAAEQAKRVMDFSQTGAVDISGLNFFSFFFRPALIGSARNVEALSRGLRERPIATLIGLSALVANGFLLSMLALEMAEDDDEKDDLRGQGAKRLMRGVTIPGGAFGTDRAVEIPTGYGPGFFVGMGQMLHHYTEFGTEYSAEDVMQGMARHYSPVELEDSVAKTVLSFFTPDIIENQTNTALGQNSFGGQLTRTPPKGMPQHLTTKPQTEEVYVDAARFLHDWIGSDYQAEEIKNLAMMVPPVYNVLDIMAYGREGDWGKAMGVAMLKLTGVDSSNRDRWYSQYSKLQERLVTAKNTVALGNHKGYSMLPQEAEEYSSAQNFVAAMKASDNAIRKLRKQRNELADVARGAGVDINREDLDAVDREITRQQRAMVALYGELQ